MTTATYTGTATSSISDIDEFDLDVRVLVNIGTQPADAGFSDWATCKTCPTIFSCLGTACPDCASAVHC